MDCIRIINLELYGNHGIFPEENSLGQKFLVSAWLYTDTRTAGLSDDIKDSIHYGEICHKIKDFMHEHTYKLIETVAEKMAEMLMIEYDKLQKISLEIKKPWAPIGLHLETVSISIERQRHRAHIALGSNLGDREAYLNKAIDALNDTKVCKIISVSDFIETEPYGGIDQAKFLNAVMEIQTLLEPQELLECIQKIENDAGRERPVRWGPRTLDLDILFYDDEIIDLPELQIPHPDLQNRGFVLEPLMALSPNLRHPLIKKTIRELYGELKSNN
ncbi:MAG: 2-amino-4-hydroxy-6-hydroxymethyldihydropteridine diphosphokinase [Eubacteriales bacterium]|nr:2-amino-4-hydroxy-6-hydroxymethyldihydropteridine diphosphokinase [Eubacteriales bacterium]MDD4390087.1 2-amino-4-hydroxy-6-hydroxymethyldihydropteridine diphosphokinase [Eubacteriales bacterium]